MPKALTHRQERKERSQDGDLQQYLTFTLDQETYAVSIGKVREIVEFHSLTKIPMMPAFLCGVTNLRGAVIPVIDLLSRFGKGVTSLGNRSCIVIVEVEHAGEMSPLGILVNSVNEVVPVEEEDIEPRPSFGSSIRADFIDSLLNLHGEFIISLDLQQALSIQEMAELARSWGDDPTIHSGEDRS